MSVFNHFVGLGPKGLTLRTAGTILVYSLLALRLKYLVCKSVFSHYMLFCLLFEKHNNKKST